MPAQPRPQRPAPSPAVPRRSLLQGALAVSAMGVVSACGGGNGGGGPLGGGGGNGSKVTELVVPTNKSPWLPAYKAVAAKYQEAKGVRITLREFPYDGLRTQMVNAMQQGSNAFDVFQLDEPWTGQFYDSKWARPLTEIDSGYKLDEQVVDYDSLSYWDKEKRTATPDGDLMGLPLNGNLALFIYRKDLYEQLGLQVPKTWDDALANAKKGKASGAVKYGHVMRTQAAPGGAATTYEYMHILHSYGAEWFVDEGTDWTPAVTTPEAVAATKMYRALAETGHPQPQTIGQAEAIALMQSGQALQVHVVAAAANQLLDPAKSKVADKLGFAVVPAGGSGKPSPISGVWSLCVPAGLPDDRAKAALEFIDWMMQKEQQEEFTRQGGIPTRKDAYAASGASEAAQQYLPAVEESLENVHRHIRYVFGPQMLEVTERQLGAINSGATPVETGLAQIQQGLAKAAAGAGFGT